MKYVIIGCSAAGVNAAAAIRRHDPDGDIELLTKEEAGHYSRPMLSYYLGGKIDEQELLYRGGGYLERLDANLSRGRDVCGVDPDKGLVICTDGGTHAYDRLLVASGGVARQPDVPGIDLDGVYHFRTLDDARAVRERAASTKVCVMMGGGLVSLKAAEALRGLGLEEVHLVIGSNRVMSQAMDSAGAGVLQRRLEQNGVFVHTGESVEAVLGDDSVGVEGVTLKSGERLECQLVLVGKGVRPDLSLLEGSGVDTDWGVLVDRAMATSVPGVFAAGDVAQAHDCIHDEQYVNALWPLAAQQGWVAGCNMAGAVETAYPGWFAMNSLQVFGLPVITMGIVTDREGGDAEGMDVLALLDNSNDVYRKLVLRGGRLVGCAAVGDTDAAGLAGLIRAGADVSEIKEELLTGRPEMLVAEEGKGRGKGEGEGLRSIVVDPKRCLTCGSCELACSLAHSGADDLAGALGTSPLRRLHLQKSGAAYVPLKSGPPSQTLPPSGGRTDPARAGTAWIPLSCHHCVDAPCVYACIAGVRQRDDEAGICTDEQACVGCGSCYMVCPVGAINRDVASGRYASCDRCGDGEPRCVAACPTRALRLVEGEAEAGLYFKIEGEHEHEHEHGHDHDHEDNEVHQ